MAASGGGGMVARHGNFSREVGKLGHWEIGFVAIDADRRRVDRGTKIRQNAEL